MIRVGSIVSHPLFSGPGTVVAIHGNSDGSPVFEVHWQAHSHNGFHSGTQLRLHTQSAPAGGEV